MDKTISKRSSRNYVFIRKTANEEESSLSSDSGSDDWNGSSSAKSTTKNRRKRAASAKNPPALKLKSILAEKTKQLKEKTKKNLFGNEIRGDKIVTDKVENNIENLTTTVENGDNAVEIENEDCAQTSNKDSPSLNKNSKDSPSLNKNSKDSPNLDKSSKDSPSLNKNSKPDVLSNEVRTIDCVEILDDDDDDDITFIPNDVSVPAIKPKFEKSDVNFSHCDTNSGMSVCENEVSSSIRPALKSTTKIDEIPENLETKTKIAPDKSETIFVKEEKPIIKHESIKRELVERKKRPIVLSLSTSTNSPYITPYFLANSKPSQDSSSSNLSSNVPVQMPQSPNISSSTTTCVTPTSSPVSSQSSNTSPGSGVARLRINPNLQASPAFETSLVNNTLPESQFQRTRGQPPRMRGQSQRIRGQSQRIRGQSQRMRGQRIPRQRGTSRVASSFPVVSYSSPQCELPSRSNTRQVRPSLESEIDVIPRTKYLPTVSSISKSGISLNISSSGTVLYSDSGSVTITPRKKSPERPCLPKRLIRTDVEGIIVCKEEHGIFRYALRLANGKHHPLSDAQVNALRKQNNGVLPNKLKIPVPSDVASQVEPRFVIED